MNKLKSIQGVEIFSAGTWNGDKYTVEDIDEMIRAYNENRATVKPSLKLGHDDDQKLLQKDGYPAAGWISNLYRIGEKLIADFVEIPSKVAELIKQKAYRKVSSEIFWDIAINGRTYKRMLSKVALLGEDMPAVTTLDDMLALYGAKVTKADRVGAYATNKEGLILKEYEMTPDQESGAKETDDMSKSEAEIKLEYELKEAREKADVAAKEKEKLTADLAAKSKLEEENAELRKFKQEADARAVKAEKDAEQSRLDSFVTGLEKDGLVSPAMKPYIQAVLGEDKKEYAFQDKKLSKGDIVREILKLHSAMNDVNFDESSRRDSGDSKSKSKDSALEAKITKYAQDNKCSWGQAYRVVMKQEKQAS